MRILPLILVATSAIACTAMPAAAQERDSFTGPRVEANAGYDVTHADDGVAATPNSLKTARIGGVVGYDIALTDKIVIGAEAGAGFALAGDIDTQLSPTSRLRLTAGRDLEASLRIGYKVTPKTLVFVKGGYANSQYRLTSTVGATTTKAHTNEDGWRAGAGVEQMINDHIYAKAEYRYTDYGDDVHRHQALIGLGYRF